MLNFIMYMQCVFCCIGTDISKIYCDHISSLGTAVAQWLRCSATNRKNAGSIPACVGIFH